MARSCKELICLGCGEDMTNKCSNRRSLTSTDSGKCVLQTWKMAMKKMSTADSHGGLTSFPHSISQTICNCSLFKTG